MYKDGSLNGPMRGQPCQYVPAEKKCHPAKYASSKGWSVVTDCESVQPRYLGCYKDGDPGATEMHRAFTGAFTRVGSGVHTVNDCAAHCSGSVFMAVQGGDVCFCGTAFKTGADYAKLADAQCSATCSITNGCGGPRRNSIYFLGQATTLVLRSSDGRCTGAPYDDWGALASVSNVDECKQACLASIHCQFMVYRSSNQACTAFTSCSNGFGQNGQTFETWEKVSKA
jgi:hypothetical protein